MEILHYIIKIDSHLYSVGSKLSLAVNFIKSFKHEDFLFLILKSVVKLTNIEIKNWFNIT
jgi:hypothetical protein